MTDDLDRIRDLRGGTDGPSRRWVRDTRDDLLRLAEEERAELEAGSAGVLARLDHRLRDTPRPVAAAAVVVAVAAVAAVVTTAGVGGDPDGGPGIARAPAGGPTATAPPEAGSRASEPAPGGEPTMALAASCTGGGDLYTVGYPDGWHADTGGATRGCSRFDTRPVEVEQSTGGGPSTPIVIRALPVDLDAAADPGRGHRELSRGPTTVDGRPALTLLWESTGALALPEGVRSYRYLVDLGDRTLMAVAYDTPDGDFTARRHVLDRMVESLRLHPDRP